MRYDAHLMSAFRRRLFAFTWAVLSMQALVLGVGTARVCADGPHMHGGVAAPDCAMHHGATLPVSEPAAHAHHGHGDATEAGDPVGPQIRCRCSSEAPPTDIGQIAIVEPAHVTARPAVAGPQALISDESPVLERFSPPSPPPR